MKDLTELRKAQEQQSVSGQILVVAVATLIVVFGLQAFLVLYYRDSPRALGLLFGGQLACLFTVVNWLRRLWLDRCTLGMLVLITSEMAPKEAAQIITSWYFRTVKSK
jgi:hypothetical protein